MAGSAVTLECDHVGVRLLSARKVSGPALIRNEVKWGADARVRIAADQKASGHCLQVAVAEDIHLLTSQVEIHCLGRIVLPIAACAVVSRL